MKRKVETIAAGRISGFGLSLGWLLLPMLISSCVSGYSPSNKPNTRNPASIRLQIEKGRNYLDSGKFEDAERIFTEALDLTPVDKEDEQESLIELLNLTAAAFQGQGNSSAAINCYEKALAKLTKDSIRKGKILSNLALSYSAAGRSSHALKTCKEALRIFKNQKASSTELSTLLNTYGLLLLDIRDFDKAAKCFKESLEIKELAFGKESPEILPPLLNYSDLLLAQNKLEECERICRRAISICQSQSNDGSLIMAFNNLAHVHLKRSMYFQAEADLKKALELSEIQFGKNSPESLILLLSLSEVYETKADLMNTQKVLEKALAVSNSVFGPDDIRSKEIADSISRQQFKR